MTIGELLIAITSFCTANGIGYMDKAKCITNLTECSLEHKGPISTGYVKCLKDGKWK